MKRDDHDHEHRELAPFTRDAVAALDARRARVRPDFAAMMVRARALGDDPAAVPAAFTAALCDQLDAQVHARRLAGVPPLRPASAASPRRAAVVGLLALAAAALLAIGGMRLAGPRIAEDRGAQANAVVQRDLPHAEARDVPPPGRGLTVPDHAPPAPPLSVPGDSVVETTPAPERSDAEPPVPGDSLEPPAPRPARKRRPAPPGPALEDEAQALWQRGELAAAEHKYRELLRTVDDPRRVDLAYGDLFALTRQMHGADAQTGVWREYLRRLPRGRFADDARAGLCQRTPVAARPACWQDYLTHHPEGAHHTQAAAELATPGGAP